MVKNITREFKYHTMAAILIIFSYTIAITFISIGISWQNEQNEFILDNSSGSSDKSRILNINVNNTFDYNKFIDYILDETGEYDVKISTNLQVEDEKVVVIGHKYDKRPNWNPNVIEGKYLDKNDQNVAEVGMNLKSKCYAENDNEYINLNGKEFKVKGYVGRINREVAWSEYIYVPLENFKVNEWIQGAGEINLLILSKERMSIDDERIFINNLKDEFSDISIIVTKLESSNNSTFTGIIHMLMIITVIFVIAIVNIMAMTLFWITDRKKEIALRKTLGFLNEDIIKLILRDMLVIGLISILLSIPVQLIINYLAGRLFAIGLKMSLSNFAVSIFVVIVSVLITSVVPIKIILKTKITEILN